MRSLSINHNKKFTKPSPFAIGTHEKLIEIPWTVTLRLLKVRMINSIDIERRYHAYGGCLRCNFMYFPLGYFHKNLRKSSTYINTRFTATPIKNDLTPLQVQIEGKSFRNNSIQFPYILGLPIKRIYSDEFQMLWLSLSSELCMLSYCTSVRCRSQQDHESKSK